MLKFSKLYKVNKNYAKKFSRRNKWKFSIIRFESDVYDFKNFMHIQTLKNITLNLVGYKVIHS
jgi:hypothetical protein